MQKFQSHKVVQAAKITEVYVASDKAWVSLSFEKDSSETMPYEWHQKHEPHAGGYFVRYADGYASFSPAEAFESGYRPVEAESVPGPAHGLSLRQGELLNGIRYHNCSPEQGARMSEWRQTVYDAMLKLFALTPEGPEQTIAARALEDALMRGNKAIVTEYPENAQPLPREVKR